jgi:hypothetical protein
MSKVSVAHLVGVGRLNSMLPHLMSERARIQAERKRTDAEILPLLGRAFEPQFAGTKYAEAARALYSVFDLYEIAAPAALVRLLLVGVAGDLATLEALARRLSEKMPVAIALVSGSKSSGPVLKDGYTVHTLSSSDAALHALISRADGIVATPQGAELESVRKAGAPVATWGSAAGLQNGVQLSSMDDPAMLTFFR